MRFASAELHYVLGSVHPQLREFREHFWHSDPLAFQQTYFQLLADAAETRLFDCLAHPDLVKNETPRHWRPAAVFDDIRYSLDRIAATGVAMGLNTSGANKTIPEMNPFPEMLAEMCQRSIPVVLGADAHEPESVADRFHEALDLLEQCGYASVNVFLNRQRRQISIADAQASLRPENSSL